jgi:hypothetical protein
MNDLEQLKQQAIEAKKLAYLPRPVKIKVDGAESFINLCWMGRIIRAQELANDAMVAGDKEKVKVLSNAITGLEHDMDLARQAVDEAIKAYRIAGGTETLNVGARPCEYCQRNKQQEALFLAESRLRRAVFDLT